ncbi:hypothetical protein AYO40_03950 [Planctomycetaceae bacterium SCGC AG-212-D15]|nr:hypothetical protein AYO40_03950 [Planctomycetaceae bacterium SCGC AG-212-D15]
MPDVVECPQCHRYLRVPEGLLGRLVKCPACAATFTMGALPSAPPPIAPMRYSVEAEPPLSMEPFAASEPEEEGEADERPRRRVRRDSLAPHRGGMILTFGIVSLVCGCLAIVCGPMAWTMANADLEQMRAGRMDPEGEGLTNAGRICGIVGTVLGALYFCCIGIRILDGR